MEKEIKTIVAVWWDNKKKKYEVLPPCGKCREMIKMCCKKNKNAGVIVSKTKKVRLNELLPYSWNRSIEK